MAIIFQHISSTTEKIILEFVASFLDDSAAPVAFGGLAAHYYGSKRPLVDVDIGVRESIFKSICLALEPYTIENYQHGYTDESWQLDLIVVKYKGVLFDIFSMESLKYYSVITRAWHTIDWEHVRPVCGTGLHVINKEDLIAYKEHLGRDVDVEDVAFFQKKHV